MFRHLLRYLQGEIYRMLKTIVTLFDYSSKVALYMGLQLNLQIFKKPYLVER